jgi:hypothetical protein
MSKLIIVGLVIVWAIVLLPDVLSRLSRSRRSDSIGSFSSQLSSLGRANGQRRSHDNVIDLRTRSTLDLPPGAAAAALAPSSAPAPARPGPARSVRSAPAGRPDQVSGAAVPARTASPAVRKRRQEVLMTLGSLAILTLLATIAFGGVFLILHLLVDLLLVAYLVVLAQVTSVVPPAIARPRAEALAPLSPLDRLDSSHTIDLRTGSVSSTMPAPARRIAN